MVDVAAAGEKSSDLTLGAALVERRVSGVKCSSGDGDR